eukprot:3340353-Amphidinium_carterae.1
MMCLLRKDGRLLQQIPDLENCLRDELRFLENMSDFVGRLRHGVLYAGHVAGAYIHRKMFLEVAQLPWALFTSENKAAVVEALKEL